MSSLMAKIVKLMFSKSRTEYSIVEMQNICNIGNNEEQLKYFNESLLKLVKLQLIELV